MNNSQKSWVEYFRFITPILITLCLFLLNGIERKVNDIDDKLFRHLTNDELHSPRSLVVSKAEFNIYQEMRQRQMNDIRDILSQRIESLRLSMDKIIGILEDNGNKRKGS
jgi:hypothetical protein